MKSFKEFTKKFKDKSWEIWFGTTKAEVVKRVKEQDTDFLKLILKTKPSNLGSKSSPARIQYHAARKEIEKRLYTILPEQRLSEGKSDISWVVSNKGSNTHKNFKTEKEAVAYGMKKMYGDVELTKFKGERAVSTRTLK